MTARLVEVPVAAGEVVIRAGDHGDRFYVVPLPARLGVPVSRYLGGRQAAADIGNADDVPTDAEIAAALRREAKKGDAAAARELREWRPVEVQMIRARAA